MKKLSRDQLLVGFTKHFKTTRYYNAEDDNASMKYETFRGMFKVWHDLYHKALFDGMNIEKHLYMNDYFEWCLDSDFDVEQIENSLDWFGGNQ